MKLTPKQIKAMQEAFVQATKVSKCEIEVVGDGRMLYFQVPFNELSRIVELWYGKGDLEETFRKQFSLDDQFDCVSIRAISELVPAALGDFVLMFQDFAVSEDELDVAFVTSVRKSEGETYYGIRRIVPVDRLHSVEPKLFEEPVFKLESESDSGYPTGFFKVIDRQKALAIAKQRILKTAEERIGEIRKSVSNVEKDLNAILDKLTQKVSIEALERKESE
jgi:hypothetical protein